MAVLSPPMEPGFPEASKPAITLPACSLEKFCIVREHLNLYRYTVTAATYSQSSNASDPLSQDVVFKALKQCITQHHALCTVVQDQDTEAPQLRQAPRMDLTSHVITFDAVEDDGVDTIKPILVAAHNLPLHPGQPQWRVVLVPIRTESSERYFVAFVCSHAFLDGRSAFIFLQAFLQALRDVRSLAFDSTPTFESPSNYKVVPALDDNRSLYISQGLLQAVMRGPQAQHPSSAPVWTGSSSRPDASALTYPLMALEMISIPHKTIQGAVEACRRHSSRLTGLLNHLVARAIGAALHKRGQNVSKLVAFLPFDLRNLLQQDTKTMANLVSSVTEDIEISPDSINEYQSFTDNDWTKIKATTDLLRERSTAFVDQPVRLLGYLPSFRSYLLGMANAPLKESFCLSNLGSLDANADASCPNAWTIDNAVFSQSSYAAGAALLFNVASTKNGALNMTVTWWPGVVGVGGDEDEHAFIREVCTDIVLHMEIAAR